MPANPTVEEAAALAASKTASKVGAAQGLTVVPANAVARAPEVAALCGLTAVPAKPAVEEAEALAASKTASKVGAAQGLIVVPANAVARVQRRLQKSALPKS